MEARSSRNTTPSQHPRSLLCPLQHFHRYYDLVPARRAGRYQLIHYSRGLDWSRCFWNILLDRFRKTDANIGLEDWWSSDRLASYLPPPNPQLFVWFLQTNHFLIYLNRTSRRNPMDIFRGSYIYLPISALILLPLSYLPSSHLTFTRSSSQMINLPSCWRFPRETQRYGRTGFAAWIDKRLKKRHNTSTPI